LTGPSPCATTFSNVIVLPDTDCTRQVPPNAEVVSPTRYVKAGREITNNAAITRNRKLCDKGIICGRKQKTAKTVTDTVTNVIKNKAQSSPAQ
jgi:hypothetical protein